MKRDASKSPFAAALTDLLESTQLFTREEWAAFLRVSQPAISQWLTDKTIPRPENLRLIVTTLERSADVPRAPLDAFREMASRSGPEVSPHGRRMLPTVWEYLSRPAFSALADQLAKLPLDAQEDLLERYYPPVSQGETPPPVVARYSSGSLAQDVPASENQLSVGHLLSSSSSTYEVLAILKGRQSCETYRARVRSTRLSTLRPDDHVIIKLPRVPHGVSRAQKIERLSRLVGVFFDEQASLRRLAGLASVAQFLEVGTYQHPGVEASTVFLVQELVHGTNLEVYMTDRYGDKGTFTGIKDASHFFDWARRLACGLHDIHQRLVVHGDIWPGNILVDADGNPKFIDFGQGILREAIPEPRSITGRHESYVAPENVRSVCGDIYSLGGVLHFLATGGLPPSPPRKNIDALKSDVAIRVSSSNVGLYRSNPGIVDIIARCLRAAQHDRIPNAQALLVDLETFAGPPRVHRLLEEAEDVRRLIEDIDTKGHPLFKWMASLRLRSMHTTIGQMAAGAYDLLGDHEDATSALTQYLSFLGPTDEYLTVSLPRFWWPQNLGINGRFLTMNRIAADRGATIRRIFLLTPADLRDSHLERIVQAQLDAGDQLEGTGGTYDIRFRYLSEAAYDDQLSKGHHFGLVVKDHIPIAIFPVYREDGKLVSTRFRAGQELVGDLRAVFEQLWRDSRPLADLPELLKRRMMRLEKHPIDRGSPREHDDALGALPDHEIGA